MSRKNITKGTKELKPVGLRLPTDLIKKWDKTAKSLGILKTTVIESALNHFLSLPEEEQREVIKGYLTKHL